MRLQAGTGPPAVVAVLVAAMLAGCSSPGASATPDPLPAPTDAAATRTPPPVADMLRVLIRAAADATAGRGTAAVLETVGFRGSATLPDGPYASIRGHVTFGERPQMVVEANYAGAGFGIFEMIRLQDLLLLRGPALGDLVDPGEWLLVDLASTDERVANFVNVAATQTDAYLILYTLYGATGLIASLGRDSLDGIATTRYALTLDLEAAAREAPEGVADQIRRIFLDVAEDWNAIVDAEVWIDDDGFVRRIDTVNDVIPDQGGGQKLISFRYAQLGDPYELTIPPDEDIVSLDDIPAPAGRPV